MTTYSVLKQGCPTRGPRARCGPPSYIHVAFKGVWD